MQWGNSQTVTTKQRILQAEHLCWQQQPRVAAVLDERHGLDMGKQRASLKGEGEDGPQSLLRL